MPDSSLGLSGVPPSVLLSDRVLDGVLGFLVVRAVRPGGDTSVENLARWDLKAALVEVLGREGIQTLPTPPKPLVGADDEHTPRGRTGVSDP